MGQGDYSPIGIGVGSLLVGRYEIVRVLGSGAMSVVYSVVDRKLNNEEVALKLLAPAITQDPKSVDRFRNELILSRKLTHPNIVRTYEFGELPSGQLYLTMEKVRGTNLESIIRNRGGKGLEIKEVIYYLYEICQAIAYAHESGVMHRDLKPGNVLISMDGKVKIADFGLARQLVVEERFTQAGESVGTPAYMAPEQIQDKHPDHRVDIYAIGVIGFELLTGKRPYGGTTWYELAKQALEAKIPDIGKLRKGVPVWLSLLVEKCMQKDPSQRFATAREMISVLEPHVEELGEDFAYKATNTAKYSVGLPSGLRDGTLLMRVTSGARFMRMVPLIFMVCAAVLVFLIMVAIGTKSEKQVSDVKQKIAQKTETIGRFVSLTERFMKVVERFEKNEEKANKFLEKEGEQGGSSSEASSETAVQQ